MNVPLPSYFLLVSAALTSLGCTPAAGTSPQPAPRIVNESEARPSALLAAQRRVVEVIEADAKEPDSLCLYEAESVAGLRRFLDESEQFVPAPDATPDRSQLIELLRRQSSLLDRLDQEQTASPSKCRYTESELRDIAEFVSTMQWLATDQDVVDACTATLPEKVSPMSFLDILGALSGKDGSSDPSQVPPTESQRRSSAMLRLVWTLLARADVRAMAEIVYPNFRDSELGKMVAASTARAAEESKRRREEKSAREPK